MGVFGRAFLRSCEFCRNVRDGGFTVMARGAFAAFGEHSRLSLPVQLHRPDLIDIGRRVYFGPGCWLQALPQPGAPVPRLVVGDQCSFSGYCVLSAAQQVVVEGGVLFARNVYVSDHIHGYRDAGKPIQDQPLDKIAPVHIEANAWLGQNVVVCPGVRIGRGAVIGAGSVVNDDVPPRTLAVGAPARVVKQLD
ncbi:MAG TPA: acyltransferase [Planctomycetota bacterium]|nr:acyltransferase [Planctomycetota bacterium]